MAILLEHSVLWNYCFPKNESWRRPSDYAVQQLFPFKDCHHNENYAYIKINYHKTKFPEFNTLFFLHLYCLRFYKNDNIIKRFYINGNLVIYTPFSKPTGNCTHLNLGKRKHIRLYLRCLTFFDWRVQLTTDNVTLTSSALDQVI